MPDKIPTSLTRSTPDSQRALTTRGRGNLIDRGLTDLKRVTDTLSTEECNQRGVEHYWEKKEYKEAARWFKLTADQGDADGQANLGMMYRDGRGVPQDDAEA